MQQFSDFVRIWNIQYYYESNKRNILLSHTLSSHHEHIFNLILLLTSPAVLQSLVSSSLKIFKWDFQIFFFNH